MPSISPDTQTDTQSLAVASPRRGRKPATPAVPEVAQGETALAGQILENDLAQVRAATVTMPREELAQSLHLAKVAGSIAAFQYNEAVNRVATLKAFAEIREVKAYKGLSVQTVTGNVVTVNTWEEFCNAHGYSYPKIAEDLKNLATFGGNLLEMQDALGLGYRDLRLLRKGIAELPPEERQAILTEVESAEGPEEVKERLAELKLELAQAQADKKKMAADMEAKDKTSKAKNEQIDSLAEQVNRLTSMAPDDQQKARDDANAKARADVDAQCQAVFVAVMQFCSTCAAIFTDDRSSEDTCAWVHQRAGLLADSIANAMLHAGIDVDLRQYLEPQGDAEPEPAGNPG